MKDTDANDILREHGPNGLRATLDAARNDAGSEPTPLDPRKLSISLSDFLATPPPPRKLLLNPWLQTGGLAMLHAWRGVGKTHVGTGVALAVASGNPFLRWQAPEPAMVLYVDGEMPAFLMWERLKAATISQAQSPADDYFRIITPDRLPDGMPVPNLRTPDGQSLIEPDLEGRSLVVLDNVATLFRDPGDQNAAGGWLAAQDYILNLRRRGIAVLLIDHDNKTGGNRGTSAKHDVLDTVIHLAQPKDYQPTQGARFVVSFTKHRGFFGRDAAPFEAQLVGGNDGLVWVIADTDESLVERVAEMIREGKSENEMREVLGCGGSKIERLKKLAMKKKSEEA